MHHRLLNGTHWHTDGIKDGANSGNTVSPHGYRDVAVSLLDALESLIVALLEGLKPTGVVFRSWHRPFFAVVVKKGEYVEFPQPIKL